MQSIYKLFIIVFCFGLCVNCFGSVKFVSAEKNLISTLDISEPPTGGANYKVGQTYQFRRNLTLQNINDIARKIDQERNSTFLKVASAIAGKIPDLKAIYTIISCAASLTVAKEYSFYDNIRTDMINNSYKTVRIEYTEKYISHTARGETFYGFQMMGHSVVGYYN